MYMQRQNSSGDSNIFGLAVRVEGRKWRCSWSSIHLLNRSCCLLGQTVYFQAKGCVIFLFLKLFRLWKNPWVCVDFFFPIPSMDIILNTNRISYWHADCYGLTIQSYLSLIHSWLGIQRTRACSVLNGLRTGVTQLESLADTSACAWFGTKNSILSDKVSEVDRSVKFS